MKQTKGNALTALYSILHLLVDGVCAFSMILGVTLGTNGYFDFLIYNFCAFALQMPFGLLLDVWKLRVVSKNADMGQYLSLGYAFLGVGFTVLGALIHPAVLGIGNALFHVGGGTDVIIMDRTENRKGSLLGIFVAPGAFGLFLGTQLAKRSAGNYAGMLLLALGLMLLLISFLLFLEKSQSEIRDVGIDIQLNQRRKVDSESKIQGTEIVALGCFLVVVLRSYVGMAVSFPWKTVMFSGLISVLAVVSGKMAGGILAAKFGNKKVVIFSLAAAGVGYYLSEQMAFGLAAVFFFNMTMPITLYLLTGKLKSLSGFAFGLLTFGLFLGFLPAYFDAVLQISGQMLGIIGSVISILILLFVLRYTEAEDAGDL